MKLISLRWVLLPVAIVSASWCVLIGVTPARLACAIVCGAAWVWLSRRKVLSLDRQSLRISPRPGDRR